MPARDCERILAIRRIAFIAMAFALAKFAAAQDPNSTSTSSLQAVEHFEIEVLAPALGVHMAPTQRSAVIAQLQQGARVVADRHEGHWYRVLLGDGRNGWIGFVDE